MVTFASVPGFWPRGARASLSQQPAVRVCPAVRFLLRAAQVPEAERTRRGPWPREGPRVKPGLELALAVATGGVAARRCLYGRWRTGARRVAALSSGVLFPRCPRPCWGTEPGLHPEIFIAGFYFSRSPLFTTEFLRDPSTLLGKAQLMP